MAFSFSAPPSLEYRSLQHHLQDRTSLFLSQRGPGQHRDCGVGPQVVGPSAKPEVHLAVSRWHHTAQCLLRSRPARWCQAGSAGVSSHSGRHCRAAQDAFSLPQRGPWESGRGGCRWAPLCSQRQRQGDTGGFALSPAGFQTPVTVDCAVQSCPFERLGALSELPPKKLN